jgi:hypothetical protein
MKLRESILRFEKRITNYLPTELKMLGNKLDYSTMIVVPVIGLFFSIVPIALYIGAKNDSLKREYFSQASINADRHGNRDGETTVNELKGLAKKAGIRIDFDFSPKKLDWEQLKNMAEIE